MLPSHRDIARRLDTVSVLERLKFPLFLRRLPRNHLRPLLLCQLGLQPPLPRPLGLVQQRDISETAAAAEESVPGTSISCFRCRLESAFCISRSALSRFCSTRSLTFSARSRET